MSGEASMLFGGNSKWAGEAYLHRRMSDEVMIYITIIFFFYTFLDAMFWYYLTDLILGSGRGDKYRAVDNIFLLPSYAGYKPLRM